MASREWELVYRIVVDICGRKGLDDAWDDIDIETRNEITARWEGFCRDALRIAEIHASTAARAEGRAEGIKDAQIAFWTEATREALLPLQHDSCPDCDGCGETAESLEASLVSQEEYLAAPSCARCNGEGYIDPDQEAEDAGL